MVLGWNKFSELRRTTIFIFAKDVALRWIEWKSVVLFLCKIVEILWNRTVVGCLFYFKIIFLDLQKRDLSRGLSRNSWLFSLFY